MGGDGAYGPRVGQGFAQNLLGGPQPTQNLQPEKFGLRIPSIDPSTYPGLISSGSNPGLISAGSNIYADPSGGGDTGSEGFDFSEFLKWYLEQAQKQADDLEREQAAEAERLKQNLLRRNRLGIGGLFATSRQGLRQFGQIQRPELGGE